MLAALACNQPGMVSTGTKALEAKVSGNTTTAARTLRSLVWTRKPSRVSTREAVGFRLHGLVPDALVAFGLLVVFGFAFEWLFIFPGLVSWSWTGCSGPEACGLLKRYLQNAPEGPSGPSVVTCEA